MRDEMEDKYEWMNRREMNWKKSMNGWIEEEWTGRQVWMDE